MSAENPPAATETIEEGVPFYPHHLLRELSVIYLALAFALALVALRPFEILPPADPFKTPEHIKPEWYFLANYAFLKHFPPRMPVLSAIPGVRAIAGEGRAASIVIQGVAILVMVLLPFIDRGPERHPRRRRFMMAVGGLAVCAVTALAIYGHFSK